MKFGFGRSQTRIAVALIVLGAIGIAVYLQDTLTSVARDLPVTLLDQERDAETLTREISYLAWAIEIWRREPIAVNRERVARSEEHTSEPHSLMRTSYAVFCLQKKKHHPSTYPVHEAQHKHRIMHYADD